MSILHLPLGSVRSHGERSALRHGLASSSRFAAALQLMQRQNAASMYCAACAAPIDFGAVWRGEEAYCSVECSLGGKRPA
jgi:hypothetical protein